jgi:hypothetical protein
VLRWQRAAGLYGGNGASHACARWGGRRRGLRAEPLADRVGRVGRRAAVSGRVDWSRGRVPTRPARRASAGGGHRCADAGWPVSPSGPPPTVPEWPPGLGLLASRLGPEDLGRPSDSEASAGAFPGRCGNVTFAPRPGPETGRRGVNAIGCAGWGKRSPSALSDSARAPGPPAIHRCAPRDAASASASAVLCAARCVSRSQAFLASVAGGYLRRVPPWVQVSVFAGAQLGGFWNVVCTGRACLPPLPPLPQQAQSPRCRRAAAQRGGGTVHAAARGSGSPQAGRGAGRVTGADLRLRFR